MKHKRLLFLISLGSLLATSTPSRAEWSFDAFIGPAITQDHKLNHAKAKFDTVFSGGGRAGYFFDFWENLGVALDVTHYQPGGKFGGVGSGFSFDGSVTAVSFDPILRLSLLASKQFPKGQLQPYATLAPGVYFSRFTIKPGGSASDASPGVKAAVGASWMLTPNIGLLGEYRYSHFTAEVFHFHTSVSTHRLQLGATVRY